MYSKTGVSRASIRQRWTAYIHGGKLSMSITNKRHSSAKFRTSVGYARNVGSMPGSCELVALRIANEMQRSARAYGATTRTAEGVTARLDGSNSLLKTTTARSLRPRQVRDLQRQRHRLGDQSDYGHDQHRGAFREFDGTGTWAAKGFTGKSKRQSWGSSGWSMKPTRPPVRLIPARIPSPTPALTSSSSSTKKVPSGVELGTAQNGALRAIGARQGHDVRRPVHHAGFPSLCRRC